MPLDALGDLVLTVGADLSGLESTLASVPQVAQQAGAAIDSALGSSLDGATASLNNLSNAVSGIGGVSADAAGQMDLFAQSAEKAAAALDSFPKQMDLFDVQSIEAADSAFGSLDQNLPNMRDHMEQVAESGKGVATSFEGMGEKALSALEGLGLMIGAFEAIKASMEAVAHEQAFTVSMTALTGSAETARKTLEDLETMALHLPVAFDSLLQATQRMQAFGIATERIPDLLNAAADAAAASGQSFDAVAGGLERVQVTGTVMARSLMQMGVTWQQVADQMGVSVAQAQAAFKKGAQSAEEDVRILVDTIESQYGGMSAKLADTVGGQFQILKNQLTELAGAIGGILAPLAEGMMQIAGGAAQLLMDALDGIRDSFRQLTPEGSKFADAMGTAAISLGALIVIFDAALGPWGLLIAAIGAGVEIMAALSDHAVSLAEKEQRLAEARKIQADDIKLEEIAANSLSEALTRHGIVIDHAGLSTAEYSAKLQDTWDKFEQTNAILQKAAVYWQFYKSVLTDVNAAVHYANFEEFRAAMEKQLAALLATNTGLEHLTDLYKTHKLAVDQATITYQKAKEGLDGTKESVLVYNAALAALNDAQQKLDPEGYAAKLRAQADAHKAVAEAVKSVQQQMDAASKSAQAAQVAVSKLPQSYDEFVASVSKGGDWLKKTDTEISGLQTRVSLLTAEWASQNAQGTAAGDAMAAILMRAIQSTQQEIDHLKTWKGTYSDINAEAARLPPILVLTAAEHKAVTAATKEGLDPLLAILDAHAHITKEQEAINKLVLQYGDSIKTVSVGLQAIPKIWQDVYDRTANAGQAALVVQTEYDKITNAAKDNLSELDKIYQSELSVGASLESQAKTLTALITLKHTLGQETDAEEETLTEINGELDKQKNDLTDILGHTTDIARMQDAIHATMSKLTDDTKVMVDAWNAMDKAFSTAFDTMAKGLAQSIVEGKSFGDVWHKLVTQLAEDIITMLVEGAIKSLIASLLNSTNIITGMTSAFSSMLSGFTQVTQAASTAASTVESGANTAMSSISGVASSALSIISTIASVVTAVFGVLSYVTERHMAADLQKIEKSTRYTEIYTGEQSDSILNTTHLMLAQLILITDAIKGIGSASSAVATASQAVAAAVTGLTAYVASASAPATTGFTAGTGTGIAAPGGIFSPVGHTPIMSFTPPAPGQEGSAPGGAPITWNAASAAADQATAAADPWLQAMDSLTQSLAAANTGLDWARQTTVLQGLVSGNFQDATNVLQSAGLSAQQAADAITAAMGGSGASQYINLNNGMDPAAVQRALYSGGQMNPAETAPGSTFNPAPPLAGSEGTGATVPNWINFGSTNFIGTMNDMTAAAAKAGVTVQQYTDAMLHAGANMSAAATPLPQMQSILEDYAKANVEATVDLTATHTQQLAQLKAMLAGEAQFTGGVAQIAQEFAGTLVTVQEFSQAVSDAASAAALLPATVNGMAFQRQAPDMSPQPATNGNGDIGMYDPKTGMFTVTSSAASRIAAQQAAIASMTQLDASTNAAFAAAAAGSRSSAPTGAGPSVYGSAMGGITINVAGSVVGVPQLADTVGSAIIDRLRRAGMKL